MPLPKILLLGATGLVGRALLRVAGARGIAIVGAARTGADIMVDVTRDDDVVAAIERSDCGLVINATMSGGIEACHRDPGGTYLVDGRAVRILTELCRRRGMPFVHLSTDHFFTGDGTARHDESAPVVLVNDYAAGKYAGERFALTYPGSLVVRTNVAGHRGWAGRPTFAEWAVAAFAGNQEITGFSDYHCSTIDNDSLAHAILDLAAGGARGLLNVGATEVASKYAFLDALARRLDLPYRRLVEGSVAGLVPRRAESLGLDVSKAEALLGRRLPTLEEVVDHLARSIAGA